MTSRPAATQRLRNLALLRRVRDRIDREYGESPYRYLMTRRIERATAGMPSWVAKQVTGQESRSAAPRAAASVTGMDITIHPSCSRATILRAAGQAHSNMSFIVRGWSSNDRSEPTRRRPMPKR